MAQQVVYAQPAQVVVQQPQVVYQQPAVQQVVVVQQQADTRSPFDKAGNITFSRAYGCCGVGVTTSTMRGTNFNAEYNFPCCQCGNCCGQERVFQDGNKENAMVIKESHCGPCCFSITVKNNKGKEIGQVGLPNCCERFSNLLCCGNLVFKLINPNNGLRYVVRAPPCRVCPKHCGCCGLDLCACACNPPWQIDYTIHKDQNSGSDAVGTIVLSGEYCCVPSIKKSYTTVCNFPQDADEDGKLLVAASAFYLDVSVAPWSYGLCT